MTKEYFGNLGTSKHNNTIFYALARQYLYVGMISATAESLLSKLENTIRENMKSYE